MNKNKRIKELEKMAWENITGEEVEDTLRVHYGNEVADEYSDLCYGDEE